MDDSIVSITKLNNGVIKHENSDGKNHLISLTSLEANLADKKIKYFDKLQLLLSAWERIVFLSATSTESPQPSFEFLFINTLRFVLQADWSRASKGLQTHFSFILQRLGNVFSKSEAYHSILGQCRVLESVVKNPWGHAVLGKILNSQDVDLNECAEYFNFENGKVIVIRLEMLLQSKCEDIAVNLSKTCLHAYNSFNEDLEGFDTLDFTQNEIDYITDIYFISLLKTKKKTELIAEIKKYQLDDGLRLLQRYRSHGIGGKHNECCKNARVWKCNKKLIDLLSNTLLANAVLHENLLESQSQLEELINEWAAVQTTNNVLPPLAWEMIRKFVLIAPSSKCIYPFCSFLIRNVSCKEQDFNQVARFLIRAINQNMNEIEAYRVKERDKLKETFSQLSNGFLLISELFNECKNIRKECLLTSFSLAPSRECLQTIEAFVKRLSNVLEIKAEEYQIESDSVVAVPDSTVSDASDPPPNTVADANNSTATVPDATDSSAATVPDTTVETTEKRHDTSELNEIFKSMGVRNDEVCDKSIDSGIIAKQIDVRKGLAPAYISEVENLKLDDSICEDLNSILTYQRYHTLTWDLPWDDLKINCEQYLDDFVKKNFDEMELLYIKIDYNQFKDQPVNYDDFCGIEKGYEQYAVSLEESEEELSSNRRSGLSSYESDDEIIVSYKKRRKAISSDSEEPKVKKKRGRKPKIRDPDDAALHRPTKKKQSDDDIPTDNQRDPDTLQALRQFRIPDLKSLDLIEDEKITKEAEELHSILEDSFKILDTVDIPPVSPRFNVYDVILNETLMPNSNETLAPSNETLIQRCNETQLHSQPEITNNEHVFVPDAMEIKAKPEKRKFFVARERKRKPKEPKEPKPPKISVNRMKNINESYLSNGTFAGKYPTLLANNELFRRKYGNKPKNGQIHDEGYSKDLVIQLPKLCDTFSNFNAPKKMVPRKLFDQNVTYSSYLNGSFVEPKSEDALTECNRNVRPYGFENGPVTSTNTLPVQSGGITDQQLENIENMLSQIDGPPSEVNHIHEPIQAPLIELSNGIGAEINDLNQTLCDFVNDQLPSYSASGIYNSTPVQKPVVVSNTKTFATTSKLVSANSPMIYNSNPIVSYGQNSTFVRSTAKKKNTKKLIVLNGELHQQKTPTQNDLYNTTLARTSPKDDSRSKVDQILNAYSTTIDKFPHLKSMPAPRQRTVPGVAKKSKSRKKNNKHVLPDMFLPEYSTNQSVPYAVNSNVYCNNSKSELPISSTHTSSQIYTTQYQQTTVTTPAQYYAAQPMKTYISSKLEESGTLKALLLQGTNNVDVSNASKVHTISNNTKLQVLLPPLTSEAISFARKPKTYSHYVISEQPSVKNQYTSLIDPVVMNDATNVSVCIPKLKLTTSTVAISNGNLIPSCNGLDTSSSIAYTNVSQSYPTQLNSIAAQVPNAPFKNFESMMNNFQVRIPRIDLKVDLSSYNKSNLYDDQTPVHFNYSSQQRSNELSNVHVVQSNMFDSTIKPLAADNSQITGDVEEFNNILKNVQASVHNNQFSIMSSTMDSKHDPMKMIVSVNNTEGAPQISIPENGFNLELDEYLGFT